MNNKVLSRIYIVGSVASEKTKLAGELSQRMGIPLYELDKVVWDRKPGGAKRSAEQRESLFNSIITTDKWILEDVARPCFDPGLTRADLIVFLDTPVKRGFLRTAARWVSRLVRGGGAGESSAAGCEDAEMNRVEFMKRLESCRGRVIVCRDRASFYQQFDEEMQYSE